MGVIAQGIKFGSLTIDKRYIMTTTEMEHIGDAEGYPDVFPIWCTDDNKVYMYYKSDSETGQAKIVDIETIINPTGVVVLYPTVTESGTISWQYREMDGTVPETVTITPQKGDSAYQTWLDLGNTGTEADFIASLKGDVSDITEEDVAYLKEALGINEIERQITAMSALLDVINGETGDSSDED